MTKWLALTGLVLLAGCGSRSTLAPKPGVSMPIKPEAARAVPTAEQLMTAEDQARPPRNDELLQNSEKRQSDKFDLPPPGA